MYAHPSAFGANGQIDNNKLAANFAAWWHYAARVSPWVDVAKPELQALDAALVAAQQMLLGLAVFEARGFRHMDIKTDNVMVGVGTIKIVDVGLPCVFAQTPAAAARRPVGLHALAAHPSCVYAGSPLKCARGRGSHRGTPKYTSPSLTAMVFAATDDAVWARSGIFAEGVDSREQHVSELTSAGIDTFPVGIMLFEAILAWEDAFERTSPGHLQRHLSGMRIARFLALDGVPAPDATTELLRTRVQARMAMLLARGGKLWLDRRKTTSIPSSLLSPVNKKPPISAAGFDAATDQPTNLCASSGTFGPRLVRPGVYKDIELAVLEAQLVPQPGSGITFGLTEDGTFGPTHDLSRGCLTDLVRMEEAETAAATRWLQGKPGTTLLVNLLANLLTTGLRPGLDPGTTTIRFLAESIDEVRTALYEQNGERNAKAHLKAHLDPVPACVVALMNAHPFTSYGEAASVCRTMDTQRSERAKEAADHISAADAAARSVLKNLAITMYDRQPAVIYAATPVLVRKSDVEYSLKFSSQAPAFTKATQRYLVVRSRVAAAGAAFAERYDGTPAVAVEDDVFMDWWAPAAGARPPERKYSRPLLRVGATFKTLRGDAAKQTLQAQAVLCSEFVRANGATLNNRVGDFCGAGTENRCYCFALRSSEGRAKVMRVLAHAPNALDAFLAAVQEQVKGPARV